MLRQGVMLAYKLNERRLDRMPSEVYVQPKINGMRCRALMAKGHTSVLLSSQANEIKSLPYITKALDNLSQSLDDRLVLDGELVVPGMKVQDIGSIIRRKGIHPDHYKVEYHVFDTTGPYAQYIRLSHIPFLNKPLVKVETHKIFKHDWEEYLGIYLAQGYEGIILRNPYGFYEEKKSNYILKYKPMFKALLPVLLFNEEISIYGEPKGQLGGVTLTMNGEVFSCGAGHLNRATRIRLWQDIEANDLRTDDVLAEIKYPELTKRNVPYMPVLIKLHIKEKLNGSQVQS